MIAHAAFHERCGLAQNFVAYAVSVLVVVAFEVVDIEKQQGDWESHRACLFHDAVDVVAEVSTVVQAREFIGDGEFLQAVVALLKTRDFADQVRKLGEKMAGRRFIFIARQAEMD